MTDTARTPQAADLQAEIETTREDLSRTVDLLTAKLDVKTRLRGRVHGVRDDVQSRLRSAGDRVRSQAGHADTRQVAVVAGVLAVALAALTATLWRRNHPTRRAWWS